MPDAPGSHQRPVYRLGAIIDEQLTGQRRHRASGFVHQQVGGCKVPIVAVAARKGYVKLAVRDPRQPQRQRTNSWRYNDGRVNAGKPIRKASRAGDSRTAEIGRRIDRERQAVTRGALSRRCEE